MTSQKTFKRRVRARAAKTGESYTAARGQLLRKTDAPPQATAERTPQPAPDAPALVGMSDEALRRGSGRGIAEWLDLLDAWGGTRHNHREIAAYLRDEHGVPAWWVQSVTVGYERARGMRAVHQHADGYAVPVTKTLNVDASRASDAFTDTALRAQWLPDAVLRERTARRGRSARFDWDDPPSRLIVGFDAKGEAKTQVAIQHEKLPDAETAERMKLMWRQRLSALKELLES